MSRAICMICFPLLGSCGDNPAKQAESDALAREIIAMEDEISALSREMQEPLEDHSREMSGLEAACADLDGRIRGLEASIENRLAEQRAALAEFEAYRKEHVVAGR